MSPDRLAIQTTLRHQLHEAQTEHDRLRAALADATSHPDLADQADRLQAYERDLARYHSLIQRCRELEKALTALSRDEYGICELCGEPIETRRLLAMPSARLCIACQELTESQAGPRANTRPTLSLR